MTRQRGLAFLLAFLLIFSGTIGPGMPHCSANSQGRILRGTARTLLSTVEIPRTMIEHSKQVMFPFGLMTGAVTGAFRTVLGVVAGATDIATGAAPYAKYAIFFI